MVHLHENFEWDEAKAEANLRKHGVSFEEAVRALEDEDGDIFHLDLDDPSHADGEDRFITYASIPGARSTLLIVSWTDRSTDDEKVTRIISARKATKQDKKRMATNSEGKTVRWKAGDLPPITPERLAELKAIPDEAIDFSDIPECAGGARLRRDADGRLPKRRSVIRDAIAASMAERGMTTYALWKEAKVHCPTISETAVGEFLKGRRSIGLEYIEALMTASGLTVTR